MSDLRSVGWCPRCRRQPCACGPIPAYMNATPPDSGEREVVWHHCQECKNFAEARDQQYSPPPVSHAREVCGTDWNVYLGPHYPCALPRGHEGPHKSLAAEVVSLPLSLAQRILAALEYAIGARGVTRFEDLAAELRERLPK